VRATLVGLAAPLASALLVNQWLRRVDAFLSKGWSTIAPQRQPSQPPPLPPDRCGDCVGWFRSHPIIAMPARSSNGPRPIA